MYVSSRQRRDDLSISLDIDRNKFISTPTGEQCFSTNFSVHRSVADKTKKSSCKLRTILSKSMLLEYVVKSRFYILESSDGSAVQ